MDILTIGAIAIPTVVIGLHYKYTRDLEMIREFLRRTHEETESVEERLLADSQMERAKVEDLLHEIDELRKKVEELQIQKAKFEQKAKLSKSHDEIKDVIFNVIERLYERLGGPAGGLELEDLKASYSNSIEDDSITDKDSKNQYAEVPNEDKESAQEEVSVEDTTNNELSTEDTIEPEAAAEEEVSSEEKVEVAKEAEEPTTPQEENTVDLDEEEALPAKEENKPEVLEEESDPSDVAPSESEADLSRRSEAEAEEEIQDLDEDDEDEVLPAKEEKESEPLKEESDLSDIDSSEETPKEEADLSAVASPEAKADDISDLDEDDEEEQEQEVVEEPKASKEEDDISDLDEDYDEEVLPVKEEKERELPEEEEEQSEVDSPKDKEETEDNKSGSVEPSSDSSGEEMITKFVSEFKELIELDGGKENEGYFTAASLGKGEDELKCEMAFIKDEKLFALDLKAHVFIEQLGWSGDDGDNSQLIEEVNNYLKYLSDPNYLESILGLLPEGLEYSGSSVIIALKNNIQVDILNKVAQGFDFANSKIEVKNFNEINDLFL